MFKQLEIIKLVEYTVQATANLFISECARKIGLLALTIFHSGGPVLKFPGRSVIGYLYFRSVGSRLFKIWYGYFQLLSLNFQLFRLVASVGPNEGRRQI